MEKQKLILLSNNTRDFIGKFYSYYSKENIDSSFLDWNAKDVMGHILFWMKHCGDKIYGIKNGVPFEMVDANRVNNKIYFQNKSVKIDVLFEEINDVIINCINVINMYAEDELSDKTLPTGYNFEMWRYIAMDMYIHPIKHLAHYYFKAENHNEFEDIIKHSFNNFMEYSDNDLTVFNFFDFYEDIVLS